MSKHITSYITCLACQKRIRDQWVQIIVRGIDKDSPDGYQHAVGFLHGDDCLLDYAANIGGRMMNQDFDDE